MVVVEEARGCPEEAGRKGTHNSDGESDEDSGRTWMITRGLGEYLDFGR